jgi:hypothetical protein
VERLVQGSVDKIDLVLAIDNSRSMADKQAILAVTVPDLVNALVNPRCLLPDGTPLPQNQQPVDPLSDCPAGSEREFKPVIDMHVGVVSSSLGDHGGDVCPEGQAASNNNDLGHLLTRDLNNPSTPAPTYQGLGFLAWDPTQKLVPPGMAAAAELSAAVAVLVSGAGEVGYHLPKPQITCATSPGDPCCLSCGQAEGDGCPPKGPECDGALSALDDPINLRCFDMKRRFGIDFLYPVDRYVTGLTAGTVRPTPCNAATGCAHANAMQTPTPPSSAATRSMAGATSTRPACRRLATPTSWRPVPPRSAESFGSSGMARAYLARRCF